MKENEYPERTPFDGIPIPQIETYPQVKEPETQCENQSVEQAVATSQKKKWKTALKIAGGFIGAIALVLCASTCSMFNGQQRWISSYQSDSSAKTTSTSSYSSSGGGIGWKSDEMIQSTTATTGTSASSSTSSSKSSNASSSNTNVVPTSVAATTLLADKSTMQTDKITYSAHGSIETVDYDQSMSDLRMLLDETDARIVTIDEYINEDSQTLYARQTTITLLVPADNYQHFVDAMPNIGKIIRFTAEAENISSLYEKQSDAVGELENKKKDYEEQLEKATNDLNREFYKKQIELTDKEIASARNEIQKLDEKIAYSDITLRIGDVGTSPSKTDFDFFVNDCSKAFSFGCGIFGSVILLIIGGWPIILVFAIIFAVIQLIAGRMKKAQRKKQDGATPDECNESPME